ARSGAARGGAREPLGAAGGPLREDRRRAAPLYDLRERAVDRARLGRARAHAVVARPLVGARGRGAGLRVASRARSGLVPANAPRVGGVTLLRRYVIRSVYTGVATALAVMVAVGSAIEFVGQLGDVGTGDYGLAQALTFV